MGATGSVQVANKEQLASVLRGKLDKLKEECAKPGVEDTPRGETAKAEVKRLRELLKSTLEDQMPLEDCLASLRDSQPAAPEQEPEQQQQQQQQQQPASEQEEEGEEEDGPDQRVSCDKCERKFNPDRIEKHTTVCKGTKVAPGRAKSASEAAPVTAPPQESTKETPKWQKDREKLKEQLHKARAAAPGKAAGADAPVPVVVAPGRDE